MEYIHIFIQQPLSLVIGKVKNSLNLSVNLVRCIFAVVSCMSDITAYEYLVALIPILNRSEFFAHAVFHNHASCHSSGTLNIVACSCRYVLEDKLLGGTSAQKAYDFVLHLALCNIHFILTGKRHCITAGHAGRNYRHAVNGVAFVKNLKKNCMA